MSVTSHKIQQNSRLSTNDYTTGRDGGQKALPRNAAASKARILVAAQEVFSSISFGQAGLRLIAARAGVNIALIARYFGSKEELYEAALYNVQSADFFWKEVGPDFGRALAREIFDLGDKPSSLAMLLLASVDPIGQAKALQLVETHLIRPLSERIGGSDGCERAERVLAVIAGIYVWRTLLPLPTLSGSFSVSTLKWLEKVLQEALDG